MGIIRAAVDAVKGSFADQWLEVIEPDDMGARTLMTSGVKTRKGQNVKGSDNLISNGAIIHVYDNQLMMLVDGGKVVDYTVESGYFKVDSSTSPSFFNGELDDAVQESLTRIRFGGQTPLKQKVFYINLQEIRGIKFGTRTPINYFDNFYNAELFLRAHGTYSIKITDPFLFYSEVVPRNKEQVEIDEINEQYLSEFLEAFQSSINQMSQDGIRISFVSSKSRELGKYMADTLDDDWRKLRGIEILSVGVASISYDEKSNELINMRNEGAMLGDPSIREGYMQGHVARGLEAAGKNANGSVAGFMGMGMGMQTTGNALGAASSANMQQMQMQNQNQSQNTAQKASDWACICGAVNTGKFCSECGNKKPESMEWQCGCGAVNTGKFCSECGSKKPESAEWKCDCKAVNTGKFCQECGNKKPER